MDKSSGDANCIYDDFDEMVTWLKELEFLMMTNKDNNFSEILAFYKPIKNMIFEAHIDLIRSKGRCTFQEVKK